MDKVSCGTDRRCASPVAMPSSMPWPAGSRCEWGGAAETAPTAPVRKAWASCLHSNQALSGSASAREAARRQDGPGAGVS